MKRKAALLAVMLMTIVLVVATLPLTASAAPTRTYFSGTMGYQDYHEGTLDPLPNGKMRINDMRWELWSWTDEPRTTGPVDMVFDGIKDSTDSGRIWGTFELGTQTLGTWLGRATGEIHEGYMHIHVHAKGLADTDMEGFISGGWEIYLTPSMLDTWTTSGWIKETGAHH